MIQTSFSLFPDCFCTAPYEPRTNVVIRTFTFQIFSNSLARYWNFSIFSLSLSSILISRNFKKTNRFCKFYSSNQLQPNQVSRLLLHGHSDTQFHTTLWFSETLTGSSSHHLPFTSKLQFLTGFQWTILPSLLCLNSYHFCVSLLSPTNKMISTLICFFI